MRKYQGIAGCNVVTLATLFLFSNVALGQPQVVALRDEPRHVPKLVNDSVRVVELSLLPGDTTLFHEHTADIATVVISGADLTNQVLNAEPTKAPASAGRIAFAGYAAKAYTHRVSNVGSTPFRIIGVEIFAARGTNPAHANRAPLYELALENERVRIWRLALAPAQTAPPAKRELRSIRIVQAGGKLAETLEDGRNAIHELQTADLLWQETGITGALKNIGATPVILVEVELK